MATEPSTTTQETRKLNMITDNERTELARAIAESDIAGCSLENEDIDALVNLFEAWLERRAPSDTEQRLREALEPQPRLLTVEALEAVTNYFWGTEGPVLSEGEVQQLVESALKGIKANALDESTLEWGARWIMESLTGETDERLIEFAGKMAMTFRAATKTT
jgi:hypothetical protein